MLRMTNQQPAPPELGQPVATVGMFDGVHVGHRRVLADLRDWADELGTTALVVTFDRHPREVTRDEDVPFITSPEHRMILFERLGIDACAMLRFDEPMQQLPARNFVIDVLCERFRAQGVLLGYNARFGRGAEGDYELLRKLADEGICRARLSDRAVYAYGRPISSSAIREAIETGRLKEASRMLGRPVAILGTVVRGEGRGTRLGFPTANLDLHHEAKPPAGVYITRARIDDRWWPSLTSIGRKPTFPDPPSEDIVEVLIPDLDRDLYGEDIEVRFKRKLREQDAFGSAEELVARIKRDVQELQGDKQQ